MRFSLLTVSALASSAAAWRWRHHGHWTVTEVITIPVQTITEPIGQAPTQVVTAIPTTLVQVTKKPSTVASVTTAAQPAVSTKSSSSSGLTSDQQAALDAHNAARADVGTKPLTWDDSLAADAQSWAEHLVSVGSLVHSGTSGQGENLYMQTGGGSPYVSAVNAFVSEKSSYHGEAISSTNYQLFGHYTQVVWKDTTKVGMGLATDSNGATYVVARYSPPGNFIGETAY
ncbi:CAP domain-containing protein [Mariannaea sp. PMI_226]|nr:CAP domain-containing protein [Mariannaea sp. PMI_226]